MAKDHWFDNLHRALLAEAPRRGFLSSAGALVSGLGLGGPTATAGKDKKRRHANGKSSPERRPTRRTIIKLPRHRQPNHHSLLRQTIFQTSVTRPGLTRRTGTIADSSANSVPLGAAVSSASNSIALMRTSTPHAAPPPRSAAALSVVVSTLATPGSIAQTVIAAQTDRSGAQALEGASTPNGTVTTVAGA